MEGAVKASSSQNLICMLSQDQTTNRRSLWYPQCLLVATRSSTRQYRCQSVVTMISLTTLTTFLNRTRRSHRRCRAPDCRHLVDDLERYCTKHGCRYGSCNKFSNGYGGCPKHVCTKCVDGWRSGKPRASSSVPFCESRKIPSLLSAKSNS